MCVVCICECRHTHAIECVWRLEDNFWELVLTFSLVDSAAMIHTCSRLSDRWVSRQFSCLFFLPGIETCWDYRCISCTQLLTRVLGIQLRLLGLLETIFSGNTKVFKPLFLSAPHPWPCPASWSPQDQHNCVWMDDGEHELCTSNLRSPECCTNGRVICELTEKPSAWSRCQLETKQTYIISTRTSCACVSSCVKQGSFPRMGSGRGGR